MKASVDAKGFYIEAENAEDAELLAGLLDRVMKGPGTMRVSLSPPSKGERDVFRAKECQAGIAEIRGPGRALAGIEVTLWPSINDSDGDSNRGATPSTTEG